MVSGTGERMRRWRAVLSVTALRSDTTWVLITLKSGLRPVLLLGGARTKETKGGGIIRGVGV